MTPAVLRLMNDYGVRCPHWVGPGQRLGDEQALGLEPDLVARVAAWQQHFDDAFDMDDGWTTPLEAERHATEGQQVLQLLRRALPGSTIDVDLWCVTGSSPSW